MNESKNEIKFIQIALLGDTGVGKTAISSSFLNIDLTRHIVASYKVDKLESKYIVKNGENTKLILWVPPGGERFRSIYLSSLKTVRGIIIVFDVTQKSTFDNLNIWLDQIKESFYNPHLVLFGNKIDQSDHYREVSTEEAKKFAESKNLAYFEVSAKTKQGMNEGFSYIINDIYDHFDKIKTGIRIAKSINEKSGCVGKTKFKDIKNKKSK